MPWMSIPSSLVLLRGQIYSHPHLPCQQHPPLLHSITCSMTQCLPDVPLRIRPRGLCLRNVVRFLLSLFDLLAGLQPKNHLRFHLHLLPNGNSRGWPAVLFWLLSLVSQPYRVWGCLRRIRTRELVDLWFPRWFTHPTQVTSSPYTLPMDRHLNHGGFFPHVVPSQPC